MFVICGLINVCVKRGGNDGLFCFIYEYYIICVIVKGIIGNFFLGEVVIWGLVEVFLEWGIVIEFVNKEWFYIFF